MTYTSNIKLLQATEPPLGSVTNNYGLLDNYAYGVYKYNVVSDTNISITSNAYCIVITDIGNILTSTKTLSISGDFTNKLLHIKNNTNHSIIYNSSYIYPQNSILFYTTSAIQCISKNEIELFWFLKGKPSINSVLYLYNRGIAYTLLSGFGSANVSCTNTTYFDVYINTYIVGSIQFNAGETEGYMIISSPILYTQGDKLIIKSRGSQDLTLEDICFKFTILEE